MDVKPAGTGCAQRQVCKKTPFLRAEFTARPIDDSARGLMHAIARRANRSIVVAEHGNCSVCGELHDLRNRPCRVRAVAREVAKQRIALRAPLPGVLKACTKRLPVRVHVCQQGN